MVPLKNDLFYFEQTFFWKANSKQLEKFSTTALLTLRTLYMANSLFKEAYIWRVRNANASVCKLSPSKFTSRSKGTVTRLYLGTVPKLRLFSQPTFCPLDSPYLVEHSHP